MRRIHPNIKSGFSGPVANLFNSSGGFDILGRSIIFSQGIH